MSMSLMLLRKKIMSHVIKAISCIFFFAFTGLSSNAKAYTLCQQRSNGSCDWEKPFIVVEGDKAYQTKPGTTRRDYLAPSWEARNGVYIKKDPGGQARYSQPGMIIEENKVFPNSPKVYPTSPNTGRRDYSAPTQPSYMYMRP
jgi:hypothetical protein